MTLEFFKGIINQFQFSFLQISLYGRLILIKTFRVKLQHIFGQVAKLDLVRVAKDKRVFQNVFQFPDVPRKRVIQ